MNELDAIRRWARLPANRSLLGFVAIVGLGFAAMGMAWLGASPETILAQQIPWVVSGGMTGLALVILGSALVVLHTRRLAAARALANSRQATLLAERVADRLERRAAR